MTLEQALKEIKRLNKRIAKLEEMLYNDVNNENYGDDDYEEFNVNDLSVDCE